MARLIDADSAVELLRSLGSRDYRREKGTIADAMKMLSHPAYTPTIDAVSVVRCKDCKHYMTIHCTCDGCCISDDWYCADGERKDNER